MPPAPDDERHLLSGISAISKYAFDETVASSVWICLATGVGSSGMGRSYTVTDA
jgi:hypothetical protein